MEATWRQPQTLKGLSAFLVEHAPCGSGFDVSHPAGLGSGRVSMTCRGCASNYEYATATIEFEREVEFVPIGHDCADVPPPPPAPTRFAQPAPVVIERGPVEKGDAPDSGADPPPPPTDWTRERLITAGLLLFSAAALIFVVIRVTGDSEESTSPPSIPGS